MTTTTTTSSRSEQQKSQKLLVSKAPHQLILALYIPSLFFFASFSVATPPPLPLRPHEPTQSIDGCLPPGRRRRAAAAAARAPPRRTWARPPPPPPAAAAALRRAPPWSVLGRRGGRTTRTFVVTLFLSRPFVGFFCVAVILSPLKAVLEGMGTGRKTGRGSFFLFLVVFPCVTLLLVGRRTDFDMESNRSRELNC